VLEAALLQWIIPGKGAKLAEQLEYLLGCLIKPGQMTLFPRDHEAPSGALDFKNMRFQFVDIRKNFQGVAHHLAGLDQHHHIAVSDPFRHRDEAQR
jgi:hypothetical protein